MDAEEEALFEYADNGVYKKERTEYVDKNWTRAYMLVLATCAIGGIYAWVNKSLDFAKLKPDFLSNPDNCALSPHGRFLRDNDADIDFDVNEFWHVAKHWLCGTVLASIAVGVLVLYLFQKMAITLVWMSMAIVEVCFIVAAASVLSHEGNMAAFVGGVLTLQAVIWPWLVYRWRSRIVLCGQLLCVASKALSANPFLTPTVIGLSLAFVAAEVPLYGVWVLSLSNGSLIRTPGSIPDSSERNQFGCVDDKGNPALCCMWQPDNWLLAYWPLLLVAILWTWSVGSQLRAYIVSGCAAQWYFMNPSVSSMRAPSTTGFIPRALKHGLTTSFGSICFSGLVLPIVRALRSVIERSRTHSNSLVLLICSALLRCVLSIFLEVIEAITQFATVAMAITGQPFLDAGRSVTALLGRHLLSSVGVWIFPPVILGLTTFLLAALWGGIVYASSAMSWQSHPQGRLDAMALAAIAFGTSWMVLCFYKGVLLNIVDACYICFAMDLDNQVVTHQEVHDIYNALPTGKLVVQPDEELAYGSAADGTQQAAQAPSGAGLRSPLIPVRMDDPVPAPAHYPVRPPPKL